MSFSPKEVSIVFMGTPEFAVPCLHALVQEGYDVGAVYTQPPRPKGRGHVLQKSPVHLVADALGIPVKTPLHLKGEAAEDLKALSPTLIIVVAYGLILPQTILDIPPQGCLNVHASLLPRWRGAAPIQYALRAGDTHTGITLMKMDAGMDTGPILAYESVAIEAKETTYSLTKKLADRGARFLVETLPLSLKGEKPQIPQSSEGICYAPKLRAADNQIDWSRPAIAIERQVRALKAWFMFQKRRIRLEEAEIVPLPAEGDSCQPGDLVTENPLCIVCGHSSALRPVRLTPEGGASMDWESFLRGTGASLKGGGSLS